MEAELTEGVIAAAYGVIAAASTVVGFFLGLDINRLMATREGLLKSLAEFRNSARSAMYLQGSQVRWDYFLAEQQIIQRAGSDALHLAPSVAAFVTFAVSYRFFFYVINESGSAPTFQMHRMLIWTGIVLMVLQAVIFLYHVIVQLSVTREIRKQRTLLSLIAYHGDAFENVKPKDPASEKELERQFPDWAHVIGGRTLSNSHKA